MHVLKTMVIFHSWPDICFRPSIIERMSFLFLTLLFLSLLILFGDALLRMLLAKFLNPEAKGDEKGLDMVKEGMEDSPRDERSIGTILTEDPKRSQKDVLKSVK